MAAKKGKYTPKNKKKYAGDPANCIYRSSWEKKLMIQFDLRDDIIYWSSEELFVPYYDSVKGRWRRYFPDFMIKVRDKEGAIKVIMIEVKPYAQTRPPKKPKGNSKKFLNEVYTYSVNTSKWEAARKMCDKKGWIFQIVTEKDVNF